jgi:phosphatidylglycerophosphatase A
VTARLARVIATAGGLGYAPVAPGTIASLPPALVVWWLAPGDLALLSAAALVTLVGIWASDREARRVGEKDPRCIVIDEVAGMLVACCGNPRGWAWVLGLFLLFRIFDVWKPLGINQLQALPGGLGVVLDDVLAGVYASLLGQVRHLL